MFKDVSLIVFDISIHAPLTGSDFYNHMCLVIFDISIHAPLTGSDINIYPNSTAVQVFQSTLPSQGATNNHQSYVHTLHISIHAPLTGSDLLGC